MTQDLVALWVRGGADEIRAAAASPAVQSPDAMTSDIESRLERLHEVADRLYEKWTENLSRGS
jgi:glutamine phosphoribosylpyrophosphate amidotransferase